MLRGHPRPAAGRYRNRNAACADEVAADRGQEAGVRAGAACRRDLCGRHARSGADRADRAYRPLPRTGNLHRRGIFLQGAERSARAAGDRDLAGAGNGELRRRRGRPAEGARRERHSTGMPDRRAGRRRAHARHSPGRSDLARGDRPGAGRATPTSCRVSATPATAPTARSRLSDHRQHGISERVPALPAALRDDTPPIDRLRSTEAPALPSGSDRTRRDTWCGSGSRWAD